MRRKTMKTALEAIHGPTFEPSQKMRSDVRILSFNGSSLDAIAAYVGCSAAEARYHFWRELDLSKDQILTWATKNVLALAGQKTDLGVAYRANVLMLQTRLAAWREPKAEPETPADAVPVERLSLEQVEAELAKLGAKPDDA